MVIFYYLKQESHRAIVSFEKPTPTPTPTPPRLKWAARRKKQTRLVVQKSFDLPYETLNILKDSKQIRFDVNLVY